MLKSPHARNGFVTVQLVGFIIISLMVSCLAIDMAYYYAARNLMQSAADAGALAGAKDLFTNTQADPALRRSSASTQAVNLVNTYANDNNGIAVDAANDITFGFINPTTQVYDPNTFTTPSANANYAASGGYNSVRVILRRTADSSTGALPTLMAQLVGVNTMPTHAQAVAMMDSNIASVNGGVIPLFGCKSQFDTANASGHPETHTVRLYGNSLSVDGRPVNGCPATPPGNWGFADLRTGVNGAPGASTLADWFMHGYNGTINTGSSYTYYGTQPGNEISSNGVRDALDYLISSHKVSIIPLFDSVSGSQVRVVGYVGLVITGYQATGKASNRYIEGYFTKALCSDNCTTGGTNFGSGVVKVRLAS